MKFPVAVMDYGIGGLPFLSLLKNKYPDVPILYFSDAGYIPYGQLKSKDLRARLINVWKCLKSYGVNKIVVACHSASSAIKPEDNNVIGIKEATVQSVVDRTVRSVGVIGGGRTIRDRYYYKELTKREIIVKQRIAQEMSILIERGELDSNYAKQVVKTILQPIQRMDAILLACTHYTAMEPIIRQVVHKNIILIDPIDELIKKVRIEEAADNETNDLYLTTGDPSMMRMAAKNSFGCQLGAICQIVV